jgi:hypothetical protein
MGCTRAQTRRPGPPQWLIALRPGTGCSRPTRHPQSKECRPERAVFTLVISVLLGCRKGYHNPSNGSQQSEVSGEMSLAKDVNPEDVQGARRRKSGALAKGGLDICQGLRISKIPVPCDRHLVRHLAWQGIIFWGGDMFCGMLCALVCCALYTTVRFPTQLLAVVFRIGA